MTLALPLAQTLRDCLEESLNDRANPLPEERVQLRFGAELFPDRAQDPDECCPGIAWVRIVETVPRFTQDDAQARCVQSLRRTTLEMSVYRCMPTPGPGALVTADQWAAVTVQAESDHSAMEAALCCFVETVLSPVAPVAGDPDIFAGPWTPLGPDANCVGSAMSVIIEHGCACGTEG